MVVTCELNVNFSVYIRGIRYTCLLISIAPVACYISIQCGVLWTTPVDSIFVVWRCRLLMMASKKVTNNKCKFDEGEKVLCYEPDPAKTKVLYDSKVFVYFLPACNCFDKPSPWLFRFWNWYPKKMTKVESSTNFSSIFKWVCTIVTRRTDAYSLTFNFMRLYS